MKRVLIILAVLVGACSVDAQTAFEKTTPSNDAVSRDNDNASSLYFNGRRQKPVASIKPAEPVIVQATPEEDRALTDAIRDAELAKAKYEAAQARANALYFQILGLHKLSSAESQRVACPENKPGVCFGRIPLSEQKVN